MKKYGWLLLTLFSLTVFSSLNAYAKELKIAVGLTIPPYVIKEESRGIEYDILNETLALQGYQMKPVYVPLGRTLVMLKNRLVDGIMSTGDTGLPGCYTDPHVTYWNFAITLKSSGLKINSVADLYGKRIAAFQNARNYLGDAFHEMARTNPNYAEVPDQSSQNKLLFNGRTDVVIADRYIFEWYRKVPEVLAVSDPSQEVVHNNIFPPSHFPAVFVDQEVCDAFNVGLEKLRASGRYAEIIRTYNVGGLTN